MLWEMLYEASIVISEDNQHDFHAVHHFKNIVDQHLKDQYGENITVKENQAGEITKKIKVTRNAGKNPELKGDKVTQTKENQSDETTKKMKGTRKTGSNLNSEEDIKVNSEKDQLSRLADDTYQLYRNDVCVDPTVNFMNTKFVVDKIANELPKVVPQDLGSALPVIVLGDGNCLPRSSSVLVFGNEENHGDEAVIANLETDDTIVDLETDDTIVDLETVDTIVDLETDDTIVDLETVNSIVDLETDDTIANLETDDTIVDLETVDTIVDLETDDTIVDLETVNSIFTDKSSAVPLTVNNKVQAHHPKLDDINADTILTNNNPLESVGTNLTKTPEPVPLSVNNKVRVHHPKFTNCKHSFSFTDDINADIILTNNNPLESVDTNLTKTPEPVPLTVNNKDLTISLTTERSDEEIDLIEDRSSLSGVNTGTFMDAQEWDIYTHVETYEGKTTLEYASDETHPIFYAQCRVKRKVGYFLWNIVFIVSLITVLTFTTFSIEPSSADRLGVTITLLLTSVTFKLIVKQSLPTISYLTYLDLYVIAALVFLGLTSAQHAIIRYMFNYYTEAQIIKYDNYSIITLLAIFCAFHVIFGVYMRLTAIKRRTIMMEKDKIYMSKRKFIDHFGENARTERVIEMSMSKTRGGTRI
ncbi:unnamed protein product [Mytilus coruscus]|uniref:Neurotransmitter-gated ion-channel transmembrane domain-containing protein n=1 Tax=Mytilus coruscus TaxID=42192 RepID=A0A6J8EMW9_MYTCO|nr:unnamed protein product [Mytilus coruscus]